MVDVIVPVYRPDDKLNRLIHRLNHQTVKPSHVFFMQTITGDEKEDQRVHELLKQADGAVITKVDALSFDHGGTKPGSFYVERRIYAFYDAGCGSRRGHID